MWLWLATQYIHWVYKKLTLIFDVKTGIVSYIWCGQPMQSYEHCDLDLWPLDLKTELIVICEMGYLITTFQLMQFAILAILSPTIYKEGCMICELTENSRMTRENE